MADGSSVISESRRTSIKSRDGGLCVLCGMDPVEVAHIVARKSADHRRVVDWIRQVAPSLSNFRKDDVVNLICLCPTHHRQFDSGGFVLVPSQRQRELMREYEESDFVLREEGLAQGRGDPGRTFPELVSEFEYIPIQGGPFRIHVHNPTPHDPSVFVFDNIDYRPCRLLHFRASHIALMVQADPHLSSVTRFQSPRGDMAETDVSSLLRLYRRQPRGLPNPSPMNAISVPNNYEAFCALLEQPNSHPNARILTSIPSSPPPTTAPVHSMSDADDGPPDLTASSSASTDISSQAEGPYRELYPERDLQLIEYAKERSITWEDLNNRPPLFGGEEQGFWRFASADDICRSKRR